ncbi:MAG: tetratricopeptide repeat protein [Bacteroidetes bacterium]|nr:tetratricopeptide repeat protein [Bacteroidota bacterium]
MNSKKIFAVFTFVLLGHWNVLGSTFVWSATDRTSSIDTTQVNTLNLKADALKEIHPDSTLYYSQKAVALAQKINFKPGLAQAAMNSGNAYIILSQYKEAFKEFSKAQQIFSELIQDSSSKVFKTGLARAYASMAVVHSEVNDYSMALHFYTKALKIYLETGQKNHCAKVYNNIGIVYQSQKRYPQALEYLQKALTLQKETGDASMPTTLTNMGAIAFEQHHDAQAEQYYKQAEKAFEKIGASRNNALLLTYWGDLFQRKKEFAKAENYYQKALASYQSMQNDFGTALVFYKMSGLQLELGQFAEALTWAQKSLQLAQSIGTQDQIIEDEKRISEIYSALKQPEPALIHFQKYIAARDSVNNWENNKKFLRAEMNFEYQKKEALIHEKNKRQNQLFWFVVVGGLLLIGLVFVTYNRLQIKRRLTLQKEVAEYEQKALHLQMNPHFVFNCLSSISSFIVQNGTDSAIKYLAKFSKLMRLTLEYSKASLIPVHKEIESLQHYLELEQLRFNRKFEFTIQADASVEDDMALAPLLIQPFVENAILHGIVPKESNGNIKVAFKVEQEQLVCTITDDGIGLSKSRNIKENSVTAHESMALEITKKRLEMMESTTLQKARVVIEEINPTHSATGTRVTLYLPIQYINEQNNKA